MLHGLPEVKQQVGMCAECCEAKLSRSFYKSEMSGKESRKLEAVHSYVFGPYEVKTIEGNHCFVSYEYTREMLMYIFTKKSDVFEVLKNFKLMVEKERNCVISKLRTDGGGEYTCTEFEIIFGAK